MFRVYRNERTRRNEGFINVDVDNVYVPHDGVRNVRSSDPGKARAAYGNSRADTFRDTYVLHVLRESITDVPSTRQMYANVTCNQTDAQSVRFRDSRAAL